MMSLPRRRRHRRTTRRTIHTRSETTDTRRQTPRPPRSRRRRTASSPCAGRAASPRLPRPRNTVLSSRMMSSSRRFRRNKHRGSAYRSRGALWTLRRSDFFFFGVARQSQVAEATHGSAQPGGGGARGGLVVRVC